MPRAHDEELTNVRRATRAALVTVRYGQDSRCEDNTDDCYRAPFGFYAPIKWSVIEDHLRRRYSWYDYHADEIVLELKADTHFHLFEFDGKPWSISVKEERQHRRRHR